MIRKTATTALILFAALGTTACASEPAPVNPPPAAVADEASDSDAEKTDQTVTTESVIPDGARPGSTDFPFPVPKDWAELAPFAEEKIGKDIAMSGMLEYPGDAADAAETYRQLLEEAGYVIHPNPLGEQVHAATFIVEGTVSGQAYAGTVDFDTDAAGTQRVLINLTQD